MNYFLIQWKMYDDNYLLKRFDWRIRGVMSEFHNEEDQLKARARIKINNILKSNHEI